MSKIAARPSEAGAGPEGHDSEKRRQILEGAREVFRAKGYEGASMDGIAKAAGVSKGTLYVYFTNKDELFAELIADEKRELAAALDAFQPSAESFRDNLRAFAINLNELLTTESHMSSIRMVVGAVEKFPAVGAMFFRAGAERGTTRLTDVFDQAIKDGRIKPCDPTVAAQHFMALCTAELMKKSLFGCQLRPTQEGVERIVDNGLDVFMTYYGAKD
ncbi:TetR/AcrR family transcriptional regulator [Pleomorphomonas sp. PLEO]|uniref:TetR/AcrR family transcriptional regulator n=1 Tax=Pleomorphomonas sp. PLEO TaxID=3239306 RepID=UPI00351F5792